VKITVRCRGPLRSLDGVEALFVLGVRQPLHREDAEFEQPDHLTLIIQPRTTPESRTPLIASDKPGYRAELIKRAALRERLFLCGACGACGAVRVKPLLLC
jgi:hypothetical protein